MQLTTRSYGLKCFWRSLVICWLFPFVVFTIVPEHGGRFLSSGMLLWGMCGPCAYVLLALYLKLCQCGVLVALHFSWFPSLPLLSWFRVSPSFPGFFIFFPRFGALCILFALGFWPQCDRCYSRGGWVRGGLVAGLQVGRPVGVLLPWGVIVVTAPQPMGTQPPLVMQALMTVHWYSLINFLVDRDMTKTDFLLTISIQYQADKR